VEWYSRASNDKKIMNNENEITAMKFFDNLDGELTFHFPLPTVI